MRCPALSKTDESRIIELIKSVGVKELFSKMNVQEGSDADIDALTPALATTHRASLSKVQIRQLYKKIDVDNSDGISRSELTKYINHSDSIAAAKEAKDDSDDKKEKAEEVVNRLSQLADARPQASETKLKSVACL